MGVFKKLGQQWETSQIANVMCADKELIRHVNFWTRYQRLECGFHTLFNSLKYVRDEWYYLSEFDKEKNTFKITAGSFMNKSIIVSLYPNGVSITLPEEPEISHHFVIRSKTQKLYSEELEYKRYWLEEVFSSRIQSDE
ncbi:MAG: hypothetical protein K6D97_08850 [Clostridia bacterium]|nr:hypothetical protein [Clostridia bacterium]